MFTVGSTIRFSSVIESLECEKNKVHMALGMGHERSSTGDGTI